MFKGKKMLFVKKINFFKTERNNLTLKVKRYYFVLNICLREVVQQLYSTIIYIHTTYLFRSK